MSATLRTRTLRTRALHPGALGTVRSLLRRHGGAVIPVLLAVAVTASASGVTLYRIRSGDTLSAIAARYHTTVARLVALNHLPGNGNLIYAGAVLKIPGRSSTAAPRTGWRTVTRPYVVRSGDSLYAIAARFHASAREIARINHLPRSLIVMLGQRLAIPQRVRVSAAPAPGLGGLRPSLFAGRWVPGRLEVAGLIRSTAHRWGIDPRLALGVSWQESGWNQRMVSAVGAIGAMQVMPGTGRFVADYVVHRPLDLLDARDNVTAGVALLAILLRETRGHEAEAVAGYYQGLASVRHRGMFRDTRRYVANVLALRNRF
jgi:soluble lytic murein transglycosylase-like protein